MARRTPYVVENDNKGEKVYDLYSRLLKDRIIFITSEIDDDTADDVVAQLLLLEAKNSDEPVSMYINSPGGSVTAMFAIFDVMTYIKPEIHTIGYGHCMSAGSFLLSAGEKGHRSVLFNTQIMLHELSTGNSGKFNDIKVAFEHSEKLYDKMAKYYVNFTGQKLNKIKKDMERDHYLTAQEALEYGLIDNVYDKR